MNRRAMLKSMVGFGALAALGGPEALAKGLDRGLAVFDPTREYGLRMEVPFPLSEVGISEDARWCQRVLQKRVRQFLPIGTRYELRWDPNPLCDWGRIHNFAMYSAPAVFASYAHWEPVSEPFLSHEYGLYLVDRCVVQGR